MRHGSIALCVLIVVAAALVSSCDTKAELGPGIGADAAASDADTSLPDGAGGGGADPADSAAMDAQGAPVEDVGAELTGKRVHHIMQDTVEREFIVYMPEGTGTGDLPVVFMLHGTSGDGEKFYNISGWREKAQAEGLIAVFPSALTYCFFEDENHDGDYDDPGEDKLTSKWTHGQLGQPDGMPLCTEEDLARLPAGKRALVDHPLADDVVFFDAMLDFLNAHYPMDETRVYVSGFSNGGQMALRLTQERADRFAATAAAAANLTMPPAPAVRPLSVVLSVGSKDDRLLAALGVTSLPLTESLLDDHPGIGTLAIAPLLTTLQLEDEHSFDAVTVQGRKILRFTFASSTVGASNSLQFVVLEDLEHLYPNGDNYPVSAPNLLWEFFSGQIFY